MNQKEVSPHQPLLNRHYMLMCGILAVLGAIGGLVGDVFSLWIPEPDLFVTDNLSPEMRLMTLLSQKSSMDLLIGSLLGILTLPLHMFGFFLMAYAIRPAGKTRALTFLLTSCMMATVGAGFHGSIALVGETARAGDTEVFLSQMALFIPWWWMLTGGFVIVSMLLAFFMRNPMTLFPRWSITLSPLPVSLVGCALLWGLVQVQVSSGIVWLMMICGINFPLLLFHAVTSLVLIRQLKSSGPSAA